MLAATAARPCAHSPRPKPASFTRSASIGWCRGDSCNRRTSFNGYPRYYLVRASQGRHDAIRSLRPGAEYRPLPDRMLDGVPAEEHEFCEDCWLGLLESDQRRQRRMEAESASPAPGQAAAAPESDAEDCADFPEAAAEVFAAIGRGFQSSEAKLEPESIDALRGEIARYLGKNQKAVELRIKMA